MYEIKLITPEEAKRIIESEKPVGKYNSKWEPEGLFYYITEDHSGNTLFVAIDNSDGHCWVEEFYSIGSCMAWLRGQGEQDD